MRCTYERILHTVVGNDLPTLVIALAPLPQHNGGSIMHAAMVLISVERVEVQVDVVNHPYAAESAAYVPALGPQHRLVEIFRIVGDEPNLMITRI